MKKPNHEHWVQDRLLVSTVWNSFDGNDDAFLMHLESGGGHAGLSTRTNLFWRETLARIREAPFRWWLVELVKALCEKLCSHDDTTTNGNTSVGSTLREIKANLQQWSPCLLGTPQGAQKQTIDSCQTISISPFHGADRHLMTQKQPKQFQWMRLDHWS